MATKTNLTINPQRLWDSLMGTARIGGTPKGGIKRLTLSDEDKRVRDWFKSECEKLGCTVKIDSCGNMFAIRPGKRNDLLPIAMGSHFDTQPTGGKFDGVLGVLGPLEAMRTLADMGYETNAPVMIVNWTNRRRVTLCARHAGVRRLCRRLYPRLCLFSRRPAGHDFRRRTPSALAISVPNQ